MSSIAEKLFLIEDRIMLDDFVVKKKNKIILDDFIMEKSDFTLQLI